jgi:hypothetical protein
MTARKAIKDKHIIFVKVSESDHQKLSMDAHKAFMNVSQYVRHKLGLTKEYND